MFATSLVISLLTTLITYQIVAVCTDLILGCKPRCTARVQTIHILLMSRRFSPLAVLNAVLRHDVLTRLYFRFQLANHPDAVSQTKKGFLRDDNHVKLAPVTLLALLLIIPPVVSILAIGATIENESMLTIRETGFKGVQMCLYPDGRDNGSVHLQRTRYTEMCDTFPVQQFPNDIVTARVLICTSGPPILPLGLGQGLTFIAVHVFDEVRIHIRVGVGKSQMEQIFTGYLRTDARSTFWLKAKVDKELGRKAVAKGAEKLREVCGDGPILDNPTFFPLGTEEKPGLVLSAKWGIISCHVEIEKERAVVRETMAVMSSMISIEHMEGFKVKRDRFDLNFTDAGNEPFLKRRTRFMGIGVMAVLALVAVVVRVIVGIATYNDVGDGIERVVKERLGLEYCDSLLNANLGRRILNYTMSGHLDD